MSTAQKTPYGERVECVIDRFDALPRSARRIAARDLELTPQDISNITAYAKNQRKNNRVLAAIENWLDTRGTADYVIRNKMSNTPRPDRMISIDIFMNERTVQSDTASMPFDEFHAAYVNWLEDTDATPVSKAPFKYHIQAYHHVPMAADAGEQHIYGIALK